MKIIEIFKSDYSKFIFFLLLFSFITKQFIFHPYKAETIGFPLHFYYTYNFALAPGKVPDFVIGGLVFDLLFWYIVAVGIVEIGNLLSKNRK